MLKKASSKAGGESKPEAYPLGYVEDFDEPRTPLAVFFSILLGAAAFWAKARLFCGLTLFGSQGKELFALSARTNFEIAGSLVVNIGR
jgi:hypothetical protein